MTSTDDEILKSILEEDENESMIPHDIHELTEKLNFFVTNNFLTQPQPHQQSLRIYYSSSEKVSTMLCELVQTLCKHLKLPDSVYKDFEYGFNTVINDIVKTNTKLTSNVLSDSQNNSPSGKMLGLNENINVPSSPLNIARLDIHSDSNENVGSDDKSSEKEQIKVLKDKIESLKNQLKEAYKETELSENTITNMSHEHKNLENIFNKKLLELKIQIDQKNYENDSLKDDVVILKSKIKSAEDRVDSYKRQLEEVNAMNERMLTNVQTANNKLIKKSQKISELKGQVTNLNLKLKSLSTTEETKDGENADSSAPYTSKEKLRAMKAEDAIKLLTDANIKRENEIQKKDKIIQKSFEIIQKELSLIHEYEYRASLYDEQVDHNKRIIQSQSNANQQAKRNFEELKELLNEKENENKELKGQINNLKKQFDSTSSPISSTRFVSSPSNSGVSLNQVFSSEDGEVRYGTISEMKNEIDRLRGSVDILGSFIEDLLTKEDRTAIPLLQSTAPIFEDEILQKTILERIEQMKLTFSSYKKSPETDFFFQVFKNNTIGEMMIKSYIESGRHDLYAFLVALSAVDKRLLSFIRYQDTILESLNEYVPEGYENTEESMISFVADSRRVYDYLMQIYEILHGSAKRSKKEQANSAVTGFASIFEMLRQFKGMANMIENTFRKEPFNFKDSLNELPLFLQDYAIETNSQLKELQRMNIEKNQVIQELSQQVSSKPRKVIINDDESENEDNENIAYSGDYDELNAQIKRLSERIESQTQNILSQKATIDIDQKKIDRLNGQIEELMADQKESEINLNSYKIKCEELVKQNEKLNKEVEHYQETLEAKAQIYENRLETNLQSIQNKCDDEIKMITNKYKEQETLLNNTLQKKITKIQSLKSRLRDLQQTFDETTIDQRAEIIKMKKYIEESDRKIQDMETKIAALKKAQELAQQQHQATKQSIMYMSAFSPLQSATISFPVSPNINDTSDILLSPSNNSPNVNGNINSAERTEVNLLSTPTSAKSVNMANSGLSALTLSALNEKNDRFAAQIGRILSQYFQSNSKLLSGSPNTSLIGSSSTWTRTKVINSVQTLVDRVISLEKKVNNSILIDVSSFREDKSASYISDEIELQQQKSKMAEIIRQGSLWQAWSNEAVSLIGAERGNPEENRKTIRDFILTTASKCKLVFKLQLLRAQKRILIKNNTIMAMYLSPTRFDNSNPFLSVNSIAPLILVASLCLKLKKYSKNQNSSSSNSGFNTPSKVRLNRLAITPQ